MLDNGRGVKGLIKLKTAEKFNDFIGENIVEIPILGPLSQEGHLKTDPLLVYSKSGFSGFKSRNLHWTS